AEATGDTWKGKYAGSSAALKETGRLLFAAVEFTAASAAGSMATRGAGYLASSAGTGELGHVGKSRLSGEGKFNPLNPAGPDGRIRMDNCVACVAATVRNELLKAESGKFE